MTMESVVMAIRVLAGVMVLCVIQETNAADKWAFTKHCGETLGRTDKTGLLYIEPADISANTNECTVTIESERFAIRRNTRVMFSFVTFNLRDSCTDTGVRVRDVDPVSGAQTPIGGLPTGYFCGHNTTLETASGPFTASHNAISITFRWSDAGRRSNNSRMQLQFASFVTAPCEIKETVTDPCNSSRCVSSEAKCLEGISTCKSVDEDDCSEDEDDGGFSWKNFPTMWVTIGSSILVFVCIGFSIVCRYFVVRGANRNKSKQPVQYAPYGNAASPYMVGQAGMPSNDSANQPSVTFGAGAGAYNTEYSSGFDHIKAKA